MPIRVEAYTLTGVVSGLLAWPGHLRDALETSTELLVEAATYVPLDGRPTSTVSTQPLVVDEVVVAVPDEDMPGPVHAAWHAVSIDAGPYRLEGELATMPGFDPGRALARPTGTFVLLRDVHLSLLDRLEEGEIRHPQALVNRYTVDSVEADLMLGFFFPGARIAVDPAGTTVMAAGAGETTAAATSAAPDPIPESAVSPPSEPSPADGQASTAAPTA